MIDKNIRLQPHHSRDLLVGRRSDGKRPKYQPPSQGGGFANTGGGGGGQDHPNRGWQTYTAPAPAPAPAPSPHRDSAANLIAEATAMETARKTAEANQAVQEARSKVLGTSLHGGPTYDQDKVDLTKMIRDQALEKMDYIPDDTTQLDLNKFGETVEYKNHPEAIQKQLEETTKQLSTPKGTKEALREFQALKTGRQYIPDVGLLERLGIKKPQGILSNLTSGKMFDPKSMAFNALKNMALRKLGLGFLNPFLGIASLFGFDPFKGIQTAFTNKFAKKPAFDVDAASKLGLYDTGPVDSTLTARDVGTFESDIPTQIALGKKGVFESGRELLGLEEKPERTLMAGIKDMSTYQIKDFKGLDMRDKMEKSGIEIPDPLSDEEKQRLEKLRKLRESKVSGSTGTAIAAYGGRIDKPLMGRSRDI